ncbi:uncharacterized protein LOC125228872 isoform X2 [Leguminivora glycinivorella]|uniref:uncharacterized protein LOC125228872 isoform X2 n=1 Tax=Leguminivora glycinivorella TaxID=1035111 RepID=UPI0020100FA3|nr:uncharacterized protein LOC125228872 isoform X2 [Leguminivora glycinivorella]
MAFKLLLLAAMLQLATCKPTLTLGDMEIADDTEAVGSYVREVRAAAPEDYHKSYENEGDGEIGYSRKKQGGGKKGYQHFDSYHKKAGDNYEFEKQDSFGHDDGGNKGAYSHNHERKVKADQTDHGDHSGAYSYNHERKEKAKKEKYREPEYEAEERSSGEQKDDHTHEELKEGASDGNGGVEAHGHDPRDYVLPEKYIEGDEYKY